MLCWYYYCYFNIIQLQIRGPQCLSKILHFADETNKSSGNDFKNQYTGAEASNVDNKELSLLNCEGFEQRKNESSLEMDNVPEGFASKKRQKLHWGYNMTLVDSSLFDD